MLLLLVVGCKFLYYAVGKKKKKKEKEKAGRRTIFTWAHILILEKVSLNIITASKLYSDTVKGASY